MKIVVDTQFRENYGAHDWNREGECPQYWKMKGGDTYVVHGVSVEQAMDRTFWDMIKTAIEFRTDYVEEYIIDMRSVDDCDYDESTVVPEWDSPINLVFAEGQFLATRYTPSDFASSDIAAKLEQWIQINGERKDYKLMYEMKDGRTLMFDEWMKEQEAA